ncbi:MAG: N-acetylmuramic acid 6-phosphate etherase [Selenomonadaceae bacterium]|nr:N-acetylmuramic acid 6-phosphate etherase [Selenomonadaceae bacterium]
MVNLDLIATEQRNDRTAGIDEMTTAEMLRVINEEDMGVPQAVSRCLNDIAAVVDEVTARLRQGGHLYYLGAGTSGRLGILDASECPPTFGVEPDMVVGLIAGGDTAIRNAVEGAEDDREQGARDLQAHAVNERDAVIGIAASGRTPYVIGALEYAKSIGAYTAAVTMAPGAAIAEIAQRGIVCPVGGEVVTGSTRLKAGTATKLILNMISTGTMIKLGKVYGNLMVDVRATNEKLKARAVRIVKTATGCSDEAAKAALAEADGRAKNAILMIIAGISGAEAARRLTEVNGVLAAAINCGKE